MDKMDVDDIIGNYFRPKRAAQLLSQTTGIDTEKVFNTWRGV